MLFPVFLAAALAVATRAASFVEFAAGQFEGTEGEFLRVMITCKPPPVGPEIVKAKVTIEGGTATRDLDYTVPPSLIVEFGPDESSKEIRLSLFDDGIPEPVETILFNLARTSTNAVLGLRTNATAVIHNTSGPILTAYPYPPADGGFSFNEGSELVFHVERLGDRDQPLDLEFALVPGGGPFGTIPAVLGQDIAGSVEPMHFAPFEKSRDVWMAMADDGEVREDRSFTIRLLHPPPGVQLQFDPAQVVIIHDNERTAKMDVAQSPPQVAPVPLVYVEGPAMVATLPDGHYLVLGDFTNVNGVYRPALARLNTDGEVDLDYVPPANISLSPSSPWLALRSGELLVQENTADAQPSDFIRLKSNGAKDETVHYPPPGPGYTFAGWSEAPDGSVILALNSADDSQPPQLVRLQHDGSTIVLKTAPGLNTVLGSQYNMVPTWIGADGRIVLTGRSFADSSGNFTTLVQRLEPDGAIDPSFQPIPGVLRFVLPDGRLLVDVGWYLRLFSADGTVDPSFPAVPSGRSKDCDPFWRAEFSVVGDFLRIVGSGCGGLDSSYFYLKQAPRTALLLIATDGYGYPQIHRPLPELGDNNAPSQFHVVFRRLGPTTEPATVHFTTRDVTAVGGKDYITQSGVLRFAPLEVEKTVPIPLLIDNELEFDETFAVVVTEAQGIESLPIPLQLTITGDRSLTVIDRIKRLRNGNVLVGFKGGFIDSVEVSDDLKNWRRISGLQWNLSFSINGSGNSDGTAVWMDDAAAHVSARYYRIPNQ